MTTKFQDRYKQILNEAPERVIPPYPPTGSDWKELKRVGFIAASFKQYARTLIWKHLDNAKFENWLMKNYLKSSHHDLEALGKALGAQYAKYYMEKMNLHQSVYESALYAADMMNLFISKEYAKYQHHYASLNKNNPGIASEF